MSIKVLPINEHSYTSYPLPEDGEGVIELSEEQLAGIKDFSLMFAADLRSVVPCDKPAPTKKSLPGRLPASVIQNDDNPVVGESDENI